MLPFLFKTQLKAMQHIGAKSFKELNWLPTKEGLEQHGGTNIFKYWKRTSPFYVDELFVSS